MNVSYAIFKLITPSPNCLSKFDIFDNGNTQRVYIYNLHIYIEVGLMGNECSPKKIINSYSRNVI